MRDKGNGNRNDRPLLKVLRCRDVVEMTGLSRATIYRLMDDEKFPHSHRLSPGRVGWSEAEVEAWIKARLGDELEEDPETGPPSCE